MTQDRRSESKRGRRPRDRKQQIVVAASQMFRDRGYHHVSLAEIAAAVDITAGALYRHFRNKEELLMFTVADGLDRMERMVRGASDLDEYIRSAGVIVLEHRAIAALWQREARQLPERQHEQLRRRLSDIAADIAALLRAKRPELSRQDSELLTWALLAVFASFGIHSIAMPKRDIEQAHYHLSSVVAHCELTTNADTGISDDARTGAVDVGQVLPRREQLLIEATRLFDERGFRSVNMSDIGAAAGITSSSIYKHFPSKTDLLAAALTRGGEQLHAGMTRALSEGGTPAEVLRLLLRSHIEFAVQHSRLIGILVSERAELPVKERKASYRVQRDYLDVWIKLLDETHSGLDPAVSKVVIDTVFTVVQSLTRIGRLAERSDLGERLFDVTSAVLAHPPGDGREVFGR